MSDLAMTVAEKMDQAPMLREKFSPLTPDGLAAAMKLAEVLVSTGFLPKAITKPAQALAVILAGQELGMPPMLSLRSFHVVQGKPCLSTTAMLERFKQRGGSVAWLESTDRLATVKLVARNGDVHQETVTIDDMKASGVLAKDTWKAYPKSMLRARCGAFALRAMGESDGLYDPDELDAEPASTRGQRQDRVVSIVADTSVGESGPEPSDDEVQVIEAKTGVVVNKPKVTKEQLAKIHVLKKEGGWDDVRWKAEMHKAYGTDSSANLSKEQASHWIEKLARKNSHLHDTDMNALVAEVTSLADAPDLKDEPAGLITFASPEQSAEIAAELKRLGWNRASTVTYLKSTYKVESIGSLMLGQATDFLGYLMRL